MPILPSPTPFPLGRGNLLIIVKLEVVASNLTIILTAPRPRRAGLGVGGAKTE